MLGIILSSLRDFGTGKGLNTQLCDIILFNGGEEMVFYSVEKVAEMLDVHPQTIRRWIKSGKLKATKPGQSYKIRKEDLEELLKDKSV